MSYRISLWNPKTTSTSYDAGTTVFKYSLPSASAPAPYETLGSDASTERLAYVPSLQSICLKKLAEFPDQVHVLGPTRLHYEPPTSRQHKDILREVIPNYPYPDELKPDFPWDALLETVDPRLWAVLAQVYTNLPRVLRTYTLPLTDGHLPILQQIPSTPDFALVTVVDLRECRELTDATLPRLRALQSLAALDVSGNTQLSSWGINTFAKTLTTDETYPVRRLKGPWQLRVLCLRNCRNIDEKVFEGLCKFPLLSVIGSSVLACASSEESTLTPCTIQMHAERVAPHTAI